MKLAVYTNFAPWRCCNCGSRLLGGIVTESEMNKYFRGNKLTCKACDIEYSYNGPAPRSRGKRKAAK